MSASRQGPDGTVFQRSCGWVRRWLYGVNLALLACAVGLALWMRSRLGLVLVALGPLVFVPFSYARLRLHRSLGRWLEQRAAAGWTVFVVAGFGCVADSVTVVQLLTARSATTLPIVHEPAIAWVGPVWFSAFTLLVLGYAGLGVVRLAGRAVPQRFTSRGAAVAHTEESAIVLGRRQFLQRFGLIGAGAPFVVSLSGVQLSYDFRVEEREISLPHWPKALDGLRVAHLSDIHVGGAMNRQRVLHVAALTNAARPDIVLHTGDFLTHRSGDFDAPLYEALGRIHAPYGQWACLGNHDFDDPQRLVRRLEQVGVKVLRNRVVTLRLGEHPLEVGGIDFLFWSADRAAQYAQLVRAWQPRAGDPRLLLNHDPAAFRALPAECADLVLSGHMHGGQIGIQLGSSHALTLVGLVGIPDQGLYSRGDMRLYVTRCVGFYGYPLRLGIPPEIALLTLRSQRRETGQGAARV